MRHDDWSKEDLKRGYICTLGTYDDCDWSGKKIYPVTYLKYQPRGWWSDCMTIQMDDGVVSFSHSSGGHADDGTDGLTMVKNYRACLDDAIEFFSKHKQPKSRPSGDFPMDETYLNRIRSHQHKLLDWEGEDGVAGENPVSSIYKLFEYSEHQWNDKEQLCVAVWGDDDKPENVQNILKQNDLDKRDIMALKKMGIVQDIIPEPVAVIIKMDYTRVLNATNYTEEFLLNLG